MAAAVKQSSSQQSGSDVGSQFGDLSILHQCYAVLAVHLNGKIYAMIIPIVFNDLQEDNF
jgi:hypothetical protein